MTMDELRVKQYFERIGLEMPAQIIPDAELLKKLTFHQIISIPYENLQFLTKKMVPCSPDPLFQRIVIEKQGGICQDVAGLFAWFLSELGYQVVQVGATPFMERIRSHIHKTLIVTDCDGIEWLTEVAYTPFISNKLPLRFLMDIDQVSGDEVFRLENRDGKICLIGPYNDASFSLDYWDISYDLGTKIKRNTILGLDPAGSIKRNFSIGTPEGRRTLVGNIYRESFGDRIYSYECSKEMLPWAYSQFGLIYDESLEEP